MEETVIVQSQELQQLIQNKLAAAGLSEEHAAIVAEHLVFADASGIHSHGAVRVDYYAERIAKGGMNRTPQITFEETGPSSGIVHGQNGAGQVVVLEGPNVLGSRRLVYGKRVIVGRYPIMSKKPQKLT